MTEFVYVDTSALVAVICAEKAAKTVRRTLGRFRKRFATNLLEAELRAVAQRERVDPVTVEGALGVIDQVFPDRSLRPELLRVLPHGYLRGADLWHVASALYLGAVLTEVAFLTLDERQRQLAKSVGLRVV